jgi:hypothetical protein
MPFGTQHKLVECLAGRSLTPEHGEASNSIVAQIESIPLTEPAELLRLRRYSEQKLMRKAGRQKSALQKTFKLQKNFEFWNTDAS